MSSSKLTNSSSSTAQSPSTARRACSVWSSLRRVVTTPSASTCRTGLTLYVVPLPFFRSILLFLISHAPISRTPTSRLLGPTYTNRPRILLRTAGATTSASMTSPRSHTWTWPRTSSTAVRCSPPTPVHSRLTLLQPTTARQSSSSATSTPSSPRPPRTPRPTWNRAHQPGLSPLLARLRPSSLIPMPRAALASRRRYRSGSRRLSVLSLTSCSKSTVRL